MAFGWSLGAGSAGARDRGASVEILRGWEALDGLAGDWARLFAEQERPAPCVSHALFRALRRVSSASVQPLFVTLVCNASVSAIFPLEERRFPAARVLRPLGSGRLPRHEPLVGRAALRLDAGLVLRDAASSLGGRTLFDLRGLRSEAPGCRWISEGVAGRGAWRALPGDVESTIGMRGGWPRVEISLALSLRRSAAAGRARAARSGGISAEGTRPRGSADVAPLLELAERTARSFVDVPLLKAIADEASVRSRLRLLELRQRGRLVAGSLVWVAGRQAVELLTCADDRFEGLSPAAQVRYELYRYLAETEIVDALLLAPGVHLDAGLPPARQVRLIGAPASGIGHLFAGGVARLADDRREPGRWVARWRAQRRTRAAAAPVALERAGESPPDGPGDSPAPLLAEVETR